MIDSRKAVLCAALLLVTGLSWAQLPDKFENLKVLPTEISKREMMETMKSMSGALGVRCWYCHVGEEGQPLSSFDFASDEKKNKVIARGMMEMTRDLNQKYLPGIAEKSGHDLDSLNCRTCHRGVSHPRTLEAVLGSTLERKGVDETIARYRSLRDTYYGSDAYNFSESALNSFAEELVDKDKVDVAIRMLELNLEFYPNSGATHYLMGEAQARKGDKEKAIASLQKALELMPDNPRVQKRLSQLKQ